MASSIVIVDGGTLEGGGQILRNTASLSCILGIPVKVNNIRAGRSTPGLRPQHLSGLQLIRDVCGGRLEGGSVGSTEVTFHPGPVKSGSYLADTKTAGSICLLMQAALPCLLYAVEPSDLCLKGGTNADMAPQIDYLTWVFQPMAERFGVKFKCDILRRGYYPKGGGHVSVFCQPVRHLNAVDITDFGQVTKITGRAFVAGVLPVKIAHSMARVAQDMLHRQYRNVPVQIEALKEPNNAAFGNGTGIIVVAETSSGCRLAGTALGKKGMPAEQVGQDAAEMLLRNLSHGGCVDDYLQDQLIILMALAKGKSRVKSGPITLHTKTAIYVTELLTKAKVTVKRLSENTNIIECEGIGLDN